MSKLTGASTMADEQKQVLVNDRMQSGYSYSLSAPQGEGFAVGFRPHFAPPEMLRLGVFEGRYLNDCQAEYPVSWFEGAKTSSDPDPTLNYFGVKSRQSLREWRRKNWIFGPDPRGWFQ